MTTVELQQIRDPLCLDAAESPQYPTSGVVHSDDLQVVAILEIPPQCWDEFGQIGFVATVASVGAAAGNRQGLQGVACHFLSAVMR